jgi:hypothetical protein
MQRAPRRRGNRAGVFFLKPWRSTMGKTLDNPTESPTPAAWPARFKLQHPRAGWEGEVAGVKFVGGIGYTESGMTSHGLMSQGIVPIDRETGKPAFGLDGDAEAMARVAKHAEMWPK